MDKTLYFSLDEYQARFRKVKTRMEELGLDVLIVTDPANMNYISGFDGWSFYVHQCIIVFLDRDEPIWAGRGQDGNAARLTSWLKDENIRSYTDDYVHSLEKHPMDFVSDIIKEFGYGNKAISTEMDAYYFSAKCQDSLQKNLPNAKFIDANNLVNWIKIVKSSLEIEYIKSGDHR